VPLRRTVRIALWTGEEQGLLGSRAYVARHLGDRRRWRSSPSNAKSQRYFNLDNGTGKIRGIYAQGNAAVAPMFGQWMDSLREPRHADGDAAQHGGTDHLAFDALGVPAFQFIQDAWSTARARTTRTWIVRCACRRRHEVERDRRRRLRAADGQP
jgi:Zn-dependent M28 family amino/carboxypeptidase